MINLYSVGEGDRTIVILPSIGEASPVLEYKGLADSLSSGYRVVIAEPLGYGYSLSTKDKRTSENIVNELREALVNAKIEGPYILLSFSNSSIYSEFYSQKYPEEINGIIAIDPVYSESLNSENFVDNYLPNAVANVKFNSIVWNTWEAN